MDVSWMFLDIRRPDNRAFFHQKRHELYGLVYGGQYRKEDYEEEVVGYPERSRCFASLWDRRHEESLAENYCCMAYTVASQRIAFGNGPGADIQCSLLFDFLRHVADHTAEFESTELINRPSGLVTSNWTKYWYKGLRISAIANQHIHLNRRSVDCVNGHWRCLNFIEQHASDEIYSAKHRRWIKLRDDETFQHYHLDALSDLIRCYFRFYVIDRFSLESNLLECGFRENAREFRRLYRTVEEDLRRDGVKMLPRWEDTMDKLGLMCYDDATEIAAGIEIFRPDKYEKETDRLASRETYFCARYLDGMHDASAIRAIVFDLDRTIVQAEQVGLIGAANHLHRLRRAIYGSQPSTS